MNGLFASLPAFLTRDWRIASSYRLSMVLTLTQAIFTAAVYFFIGRLIDPHGAPALAPYGGSYFPFVLLGLAGARFVAPSLQGVARSLREEQLQGTLEAMLVSPAPLAAIVLGGVLWEFLWAAVEVALYLVIGGALFGVSLAKADLFAGGVMLLLMVGSLSSFGVLSASVVLLVKESDPVNWLLGGLMRLVSGVYFPVAMLPAGLQWLAKAFPLTYGLEGLRQALLLGTPLTQLKSACLALAVFLVLVWPVALASLSWSLARLKRAGALSFR